MQRLTAIFVPILKVDNFPKIERNFKRKLKIKAISKENLFLIYAAEVKATCSKGMMENFEMIEVKKFHNSEIYFV